MCRWMVYFGNQPVLVADVLTKPCHSLITQCYEHYLPDIVKNWSITKLECLQRVNHLINGDGFGMGWYFYEVSPEPCVFVSTTPPWNNRNLFRLAEKIKTKCLFCHVRAASPGSVISEANCHPFQFGRYLFMHNGGIPEFWKVKVSLLQQLSENTLKMIAGTTDTEHIAALFIEFLSKNPHTEEATLEEMKTALLKTMKFLVGLKRKEKDKSGRTIETELSSSLNFAVTDGKKVLATRYRNHPTDMPPSLYYNMSERLELMKEKEDLSPSLRLQPLPEDFNPPSSTSASGSLSPSPFEQDSSSPSSSSRVCIIASEPLTYHQQEKWQLVPANHLIWSDDSFCFGMSPIFIGTFVEKYWLKWRRYKRPPPPPLITTIATAPFA